ncbi:UNVERIFIED_CONTAM: hypothetical protein HDU68_008406 [Siphonaria sp. JEL0065]|nr:hypothetical protein HDU68_008404 [Siphonaria sp. JEL0065]KAJ3023916.1 hypothetical protein HDU68_008406 [Siphonaria sp. JEL0065]
MTPPLQTALLGFLVGIFFVEYALGVHAVVPHLYSTFHNPSLLKSKIITSQRTALLSHFKQVLQAPLFAVAAFGISWLLVIVSSLYNTATDAGKRTTHVLTFLVSVIAVGPFVKAGLGPAASLLATGKLRLKGDQEVLALYDISFAVAVSGLLFLVALLQNMTADEEAAAPVEKKKKKKVEEKKDE